MKRVLSAVFVVVFVVGFTVNVSAQDGKALFSSKCALCHGPNADGKDKNGKNKDAMAKMFRVDISKLNLVDAETQKKSDTELAKITADGIKDTKMKGYSEKMSVDEIVAVMKYIRSLKK